MWTDAIHLALLAQRHWRVFKLDKIYCGGKMYAMLKLFASYRRLFISTRLFAFSCKRMIRFRIL